MQEVIEEQRTLDAVESMLQSSVRPSLRGIGRTLAADAMLNRDGRPFNASSAVRLIEAVQRRQAARSKVAA
jgi:hypothetical protein